MSLASAAPRALPQVIPSSSSMPPIRPARSDCEVRYSCMIVEDPVPERFRGLQRTRFQVAERCESSPSGELLAILPGFGVSVFQIQADRLLWNISPRYGCLVTHDAVSYRTSHDFLLWQYARLLLRLAKIYRPINMLGMSLGGTTAVQLLVLLQKEEPALYAQFRKLVTLVSAISEADFTPRWQNILRLIRELRGGERPQGEVHRLIRSTVLRLVARTIQKNVQRSCLEASTCDEIIASFTHFAQAYAPGTRQLALGSLPDVEIVSIGLSEDGMVAESRAHRYASRPGRHITLLGEHTPSFYVRSKERYDRLLCEELG